MSIKFMNHVWALSDLAPAEKLTLLALADIADDCGVCWPSVRLLARKTSQSKRSVQRQISEHCRRGLIEREPRYRSDRSRTSDLYRLKVCGGSDNLAPPRSPSDGATSPSCHPPGDTSVIGTTKHTSVNQELQPDAVGRGVVVIEHLEMPPFLSAKEKERAAAIVSKLPDIQIAQQVLDELTGRMRSAANSIRNPLRYLQILATRASHGEFVPELCLKVSAARVQGLRAAEARELSKRRGEEELSLRGEQCERIPSEATNALARRVARLAAKARR